MTVGDVYTLRLKSTALGQECVNVFYYRTTVDAGGASAANLVGIWDDFVQQWVAGSVGDYVAFNEIEAFAINNPVDFVSTIPPFPTGSRAIGVASQSPTYAAFGMRSNRAGAGSRSSYKRISGLGEGDMEGNSLTALFLGIPAVVNLQANMAALLAGAGGNFYEPVQVKSGWTLGVAPIVNFVITNWGIPYLTSQVSRRA